MDCVMCKSHNVILEHDQNIDEYRVKCEDCGYKTSFFKTPAEALDSYSETKFYPKEEVNHPDRYKSGKFECIDVMADVFGGESVKAFCLLNAFKYIWRNKKKNGVEDIKKAVWYLNKYIEMEGDNDET